MENMKVKRTKINVKQLAIQFLAGLGLFWIIFIAAQLYIKQTTNNEYLNLVRNGTEQERFQKATCITSGVYSSVPFDPGNGIKFIEIWDYNGAEKVHYFRPIGEN